MQAHAEFHTPDHSLTPYHLRRGGDAQRRMHHGSSLRPRLLQARAQPTLLGQQADVSVSNYCQARFYLSAIIARKDLAKGYCANVTCSSVAQILTSQEKVVKFLTCHAQSQPMKRDTTEVTWPTSGYRLECSCFFLPMGSAKACTPTPLVGNISTTCKLQSQFVHAIFRSAWNTTGVLRTVSLPCLEKSTSSK